MSKKRRFTNREIKNRIRKGKRVWLWKWTADAYHKYKESRRLPL